MRARLLARQHPNSAFLWRQRWRGKDHCDMMLTVTKWTMPGAVISILERTTIPAMSIFVIHHLLGHQHLVMVSRLALLLQNISFYVTSHSTYKGCLPPTCSSVRRRA